MYATLFYETNYKTDTYLTVLFTFIIRDIRVCFKSTRAYNRLFRPIFTEVEGWDQNIVLVEFSNKT